MNNVKKYAGIIWMLLGPVIIYLLVNSAITYIGAGNKDINKPIPWIIIIAIFAPIAAGLFLFGWYCLKGEFEKEIS